MKLSNKIKLLRESNGLEQKTLAAMLGVETSIISRWENGNRKPSKSNLKKLAEAFQIELIYLLSDKKDEKIFENMKPFLGDMEPTSLYAAEIYNYIGSMYVEKSDYKEALEHYNRSLKIYKNELGEDNIQLAKVYNNLAYVTQGFEKRLEYYNKALELYKKFFNKDNSYIAIVYNNIGLLYYNENKDLNKAAENLNKALEIREKNLKEDKTFYIAQIHNNLGLVYSRQQKDDEAIEHFRTAIKIWEKVYGKNHTTIGITYNNLGLVYERTDPKKALNFYNKALNIYLNIFKSKKHDYIGIVYNNLGNTYEKLGDYDKALECHNKSLSISIDIYDENHEYVKDSQNKIKRITAKKLMIQ